MNPYIDAKSSEISNSIEHFKNELSHIRSGQANPDLLDGVVVDAYESTMPLNQVATITTPDSKTIMIAPWDKAVLKEIEKAIVNANLGFTPVNDGEVIRVPMPPMTEENRKDLVKLVSKKAESARVSLRQIRDKIKEEIIQAEKEKDLSEDEKFKYLKQLDDHIAEKTKEVTELADSKEQKILTV
jgi:ribosome recycling factor